MSSGADDAAPQEPGAELRRGHSPVLATVVEALPGELFRLRLEDGSERTAHVSGNMRMAFTRLLPGTTVRIETSPFDPTKARILARVDKPAR